MKGDVAGRQEVINSNLENLKKEKSIVASRTGMKPGPIVTQEITVFRVSEPTPGAANRFLARVEKDNAMRKGKEVENAQKRRILTHRIRDDYHLDVANPARRSAIAPSDFDFQQMPVRTPRALSLEIPEQLGDAQEGTSISERVGLRDGIEKSRLKRGGVGKESRMMSSSRGPIESLEEDYVESKSSPRREGGMSTRQRPETTRGEGIKSTNDPSMRPISPFNMPEEVTRLLPGHLEWVRDLFKRPPPSRHPPRRQQTSRTYPPNDSMFAARTKPNMEYGRIIQEQAAKHGLVPHVPNAHPLCKEMRGPVPRRPRKVAAAEHSEWRAPEAGNGRLRARGPHGTSVAVGGVHLDSRTCRHEAPVPMVQSPCMWRDSKNADSHTLVDNLLSRRWMDRVPNFNVCTRSQR